MLVNEPKRNILKDDELIISMRIKKKVVALIDIDREKFCTPRSSWVVQAIIERLERNGYEVE